jgi:hypothetical protein
MLCDLIIRLEDLPALLRRFIRNTIRPPLTRRTLPCRLNGILDGTGSSGFRVGFRCEVMRGDYAREVALA